MSDPFPLSEEKKVRGNRRLGREKVLQILIAHKVSGEEIDKIFSHAFYRKFNFNDSKHKDTGRILRPDEIRELEADIPIVWKEEDVKFAKRLINFTMDHTDEFDDLIMEYAENWELDRIALIDRVLMHMAISELLEFHDIPPKVSVNEAIDIAKKYSTDKSSIFINGILDSILARLKKEDKLLKEGRGLQDHT